MKTAICHECKIEFSGHVIHTLENKPICFDCSLNYQKCADCGNYTKNPCETGNYEQYVCEICIENYSTCLDCKELIHTSQQHIVNECDTVCRKCFEHYTETEYGIHRKEKYATR